mmetsp:Transcript_53453/g.117216  ORF Transcript_53453/g.117216 Transcript_53453/m.117216 type:complete len:226 (-) Transcript_53453:21-698(-)
MLDSRNPEVLEFTSYLNGLGDRRRAPSWTITWNENDILAKRGRGAAAHLEPGCYKLDANFVEDKTRQVRKGRLTDSESAPDLSFGKDSRVGKEGALKGVLRPGNRWVNPLGPDHYGAEKVDGIERAGRISRRSSPAYSMMVGESQESVRDRKKNQGMPGPGVYEPPSRFDNIGRQRQSALEKLGRKSRTCQWEGQFGCIFRSIHASARQTRNKPGGSHVALPPGH